MPTNFTAVLIGGPPHSGKSVFVYALTQVLRQRQRAHYVLRACPDGEGDWSQEANQALVRAIRIKGRFSQTYTQRVSHYLKTRHLPLLVDVGGLPTQEQQQLFSHCTHAILLIGGNDEATYTQNLAKWRHIMAQQQVEIIAQLRSVLPGTDQLTATSPIITGQIANLERGKTPINPLIDACADKLETLFPLHQTEVASLHLAHAPVEYTLNLEHLAYESGSVDGTWALQHLPLLTQTIPRHTPLAAYGRAPVWLYTTLAMHAYPAPFWLFDVRLNWVQPPTLPTQPTHNTQPGWQTNVEETASYWRLRLNRSGIYLDYDEPEALPLPVIPPGKGLLLDGALPNWLITAVARHYAPHHNWTAVHQPKLNSAIVVYSQQAHPQPGTQIQLTP